MWQILTAKIRYTEYLPNKYTAYCASGSRIHTLYCNSIAYFKREWLFFNSLDLMLIGYISWHLKEVKGKEHKPASVFTHVTLILSQPCSMGPFVMLVCSLKGEDKDLHTRLATCWGPRPFLESQQHAAFQGDFFDNELTFYYTVFFLLVATYRNFTF